MTCSTSSDAPTGVVALNVGDIQASVFRRETSTMPQWAGSCWYYIRYLQPWNDSAPVDAEVEQYWLPVDLYMGMPL